MLDRAGEASRAAHRAELARDATVQRLGMAALAALALLVSGLTLRFARRFSAEVLRPMGLLRDSANNIEEPEQLQRLQALGCRTGQGFLLARPVPAATIDELLTKPHFSASGR